MKYLFAVTRHASGTYGQTGAGCHAFETSVLVDDRAMGLEGAIMAALRENPSGNFRAACPDATPIQILADDARLDTASLAKALLHGHAVEIGFGSTHWVTIRPVSAKDWPTRDGRYVPASELFPPNRADSIDPENQAYQKTILSGG